MIHANAGRFMIEGHVMLTETARTREIEGRYRKVMSSHWDCADTWSKLEQQRGESGPLHFDGGLMYSYSTPIARIVRNLKNGRKFVLFTLEWHSMTTCSKHSPPTGRAARMRNFPIFYVNDVLADTDIEHTANRRHMEASSLATLLAAKRAIKKNRKDRVGYVLGAMDEAREYAVAVGLEDGEGDIRSCWGSQSAGLLLNTLYATLNWFICPILADAIQEAGCDDEELLTELRKL